MTSKIQRHLLHKSTGKHLFIALYAGAFLSLSAPANSIAQSSAQTQFADDNFLTFQYIGDASKVICVYSGNPQYSILDDHFKNDSRYTGFSKLGITRAMAFFAYENSDPDIYDMAVSYSKDPATKADYYFAKGCYLVEFCKTPVATLREDKRAGLYTPQTWKRETVEPFKWLPDNWGARETLNNNQLLFRVALELANAAMSDGSFSQRIINYLERGDITKWRNILAENYENHMAIVYNLIGSAAYEGKQWDAAYKLFKKSLDLGNLNMDLCFKIIYAAHESGNQPTADTAGAFFAQHFGANGRFDEAGSGQTIGESIKKYFEGVRSFWARTKWISPDLMKSRSQNENVKVFLSYVIQTSDRLSPEGNTLFKIAVCEQNWGNDMVVSNILPIMGIYNEYSDSTIKTIVDLYEKGLKENRIISNKPAFKRMTSDLWEYYNAKGMEKEKNSLASFYKANK